MKVPFGRERIYEISVRQDERWIIDQIVNSRRNAMDRARILVEEGKNDAVRIIFQEAGKREKVIFDEACKKRDDAPITIVPVDTAYFCETAESFHKFEARQTIGRILRRHLDDEGLTPWEFVYDPQHIKKFMRMDRLSDMAIQRIGTLQAREIKEDAKKRISALYAMVKTAISITESIELKEDYQARLAEEGLGPVMKHFSQTIALSEKHLHIGASLSGYLGEQRDWPQKQSLIFEMLRKPIDKEALACLDEINAEILESPSAGQDILGPQGELGSIITVMGKISSGQFESNHAAEALLAENCKWLNSGKLPLSAAVFNKRIATALQSTQALTRGGLENDKASFKNIVASLVQQGGLSGGPVIAAAIAIRVRTLLKDGPDDLPVTQALAALMPMMSNDIVRCGYLLDLSCSSFGEKYKTVILRFLLERLQKFRSVKEMMPNTALPDEFEDAIKNLTPRINPSIHDHSVGEQILPILASLLAGEEREVAGELPVKNDKPETIGSDKLSEKPSTSGNKKSFKLGDVIYTRGQKSDFVFLILSGEVQLKIDVKGKKEIIATVGRGDLIGEMSWIDDKPHMVTAIVSSEICQVTTISKAVLKKKMNWLAEADPMLHHLLKSLTSRMRTQVKNLLLLD